MLSPAQRVKTRAIAGLAYPAIAALCRTLSWKVEGGAHYDAVVRAGGQPIVAFWHGRILPATWFFRGRGIVALTSANFDGQWIARILEHFGNQTVAGSSSRGGMRAMLELKRAVRGGRPAAFALDGPRGPARVPQPGAAWLAGATGNPLVLFHAEARRHWTIGSWDRTQVPKPFTTVAVVIRPPMYVAGTGESSLAATSREMAGELATMEARALEMLR